MYAKRYGKHPCPPQGHQFLHQGAEFPLNQLIDTRINVMIQSFQAFGQGQSQRIDQKTWFEQCNNLLFLDALASLDLKLSVSESVIDTFSDLQ